MNFRKIIVCFVGGLAFCAGVRADDLAMNNSKQDYYAPIVTRNVFGLNPPVVETNPVVDTSLPKITPNGIMSVFGKFQVLFKVTPTGKAAKPTTDQYYTLSEGERQDDIEIMRIDNENGIVTFKNHGTVQELPLAEPSRGSGGSSPTPLPGNPAGFNPSSDNNGNAGENGGPGNRITRFGNRGGGPGGFNRRGNNQDNTGAASGDGSLNLRSIPTRTYQPPVSNLTPEQTVIQIEQNRAKLMDTPENERPYSPNLLPTTPLTGQY
jgi:hypothetical protein